LPSDNLTAAEKRKLNGPVETFAINKPISWESFKAMPHDIAQAWLDYVQDRFNISPNAIATGLWAGQVGRVSVITYLKNHDFKTKSDLHASREKMRTFQAWAADDVKDEPVLIEEEPVPAEEVEWEPAPLEALVVSERVSMELAGSWEAIRAQLDQRFAGKRIELTVSAYVCHTRGGDAGG
jgi:hypothetical protein